MLERALQTETLPLKLQRYTDPVSQEGLAKAVVELERLFLREIDRECLTHQLLKRDYNDRATCGQ